MASANTGGFRLVRCPKCLNILPEPANVSVYQCGGCNTTLRAKVSVSNAQNVAKKQVRQDSDNYSVVTSVSNGMSPQNKDLGSIGADVDDSCTPDAPSNETECESNVKGSNENGDVMSDEKNAMEVTNTENKEDRKSDEEESNTDEETEVPALQSHPNGNDTHTDSDEEESNTVERSAENPPSKRSAENPEACRVSEVGDMECSLNTSEHNKPLSEDRKLVINLPEPENGACQTEPVTNKRTKLVRVQSRSCDLRDRVSVDSLDFHSSQTSFQSKSFRASEPLQSKIMKTVDDLKGDLCEIFNEPSDCKPRTHPPHPRKQDGYMPHVAITSSLPLTAYHPAAKHSGHASRLSRSGQVAPHDHEQPLWRYRRHSAYSYNHTGQMEMMRCPHECCHSYRPPCCSSWKQERALQKPPVKEIKRRPPPRNLCRPVLRGAPFILCSNCLRLVQLPTGFAVPSRGTRRLQCGSCSQVLSYSYRDPSRKKLQSPFGGDESSSTDDYEIHQVADDFNTGAHQADPYSYSEEYGQSAGASYSTEDEQPLHVSRNSSFNTMDERSGKESKLHRLMGYSSASELMRHSPDLYESFSRRTPNTRPHDMKGKGVCVTDDDSAAEHSAMKGSKAKERSVGLPFQGMLKKGIHGLESLKLRS